MKESDGIIEKRVSALAEGSGMALIGRFGGRFLQFIGSFILARFLGPSIYGLYSLGVTVTEVSKLFGKMGLNQGTIKFIAAQVGANDYEQARNTLSSATKLVLIASGIISLAQFIFARKLGAIIFGKPESVIFIRGLSLLVLFSSLLAVLSSALRGFKDIFSFVVVRNIALPLSKVILLGIFFALGARIFGVIIASILSIVIGVIAAIYRLSHHLDGLSSKYKFTFNKNDSNLLTYSLPLAFSDMGFRMIKLTDILMLGFFVGSSGIGSYKISVNVKLIAASLLGSIDMIMAPIISELYSKSNMEQLEVLLKTGARWATLASTPIIGVAVFFPNFVLSIFGEGYTRASLVLIILVGSQVLNNITGSVGIMLTMTEHPRLSMINSWSVGLLNIALNYFLIIQFGILGGAIATAVSTVIINLLMTVEVYYLMKVHPFSFSIFKSLLFICFWLGAGMATIMILDIHSWIMKLPVIMLGLGGYAVTSYFFALDENDHNLIFKLKTKLSILS